MVRIKPGGVRAGLEARITDIFYPVTGQVATDGVVYSPVATVGTTALEVFTALIDPGVTIGLQQLGVGLTQTITGVSAANGGSINYYWRVRTEADILGTQNLLKKFTGAYVNITGTYLRPVGTLIAAEDTFSHNAVTIGSIPFAPIRISLMAQTDNLAALYTVKVKNSSFVQLKGIAIPGA